MDAFGQSYLFFSLTARLPALTFLVSAICLILFMSAVVYSFVPVVTIVLITVMSVLKFLDYIVGGVYVVVYWLEQGRIRLVAGVNVVRFSLDWRSFVNDTLLRRRRAP